MSKKKTVTKKRPAQRLDKPPARVFVTLDELGPNKASKVLSDAKKDANADVSTFGETWIYEYRLVDPTARAVVAADKEALF